MAEHLGYMPVGSTVYHGFTTHAASGANVAPLSGFEAADLAIYKDGSGTQRSSASGITMTSPFDSITGGHMIAVDLSDNSDAGFYAAGHHYEVWLVPDTETVGGLTVFRVLFSFDIGVAPASVSSIANDAITAASIATDAGTEFATAVKTALLAAVISGVAQGAGSAGDKLQLASGAVTSDDQYNGYLVAIVGGSGKGQQRQILDSTDIGDVIQVVGGNWETAVNNTSIYVIFSN